MYRLQHTDRPFGSCERIRETAWRDYSKHQSARAAVRAWRKARKAMRRRCGPSAWDDSFRLLDPDGTQVDPYLYDEAY